MTNNAIDLEKLKNALLKDDAATRLESGSPWTCPEYRAIVNAARAHYLASQSKAQGDVGEALRLFKLLRAQAVKLPAQDGAPGEYTKIERIVPVETWDFIEAALACNNLVKGLPKPQEGWRPIETAPKNDFIIVTVEEHISVNITFPNPTHWMPLPKSPLPSPPKEGQE
jgi:hypothetical protein